MSRFLQQLMPRINKFKGKRGLPSLLPGLQDRGNIPRIDLERFGALRRAQPINVGPGGFGGNQLIPGSGLRTPPPPNLPSLQGLIDMSDDELMQYIPTRNIRAGSKTFKQRQTPEEFRQRLQQQINLKPGDKGFGQDARAFIARPPQGRPAPVDPFRQGISPIEQEGQIFRPADQIAVGRPVPPPAGKFEDTLLDFGKPIVNLAERPPVQAGGRDLYNQITPDLGSPKISNMTDDLMDEMFPGRLDRSGPGLGIAREPETTVNLPPDVQVQAPQPPPPLPASVPQGDAPFASSVKQVASGLDPLTEQLLFGIGGQGGFIPGAMRAAERAFYDDEGNPIVIDEKVAGFSPDQLAAMQLQRQSVGIQDPYLQQAAGAYGTGIQSLEEGLQRGRSAAVGSLGATARGLGSLQEGLGESADILRGTIGGYDPSMTRQFYDPFEDQVVQQTISDIMEQGAKGDIAARAGDIARGGQSAFGSRARLGAAERQEALGRGLGEALSGIRSRGFREAQQTGLGEFARQKAAERAASSGLAGLAGQGFGGSQALAGALSGLGQTEQNIGQQRMSGQFGLGSSLQGLGAQAAGASASDISSLYGMGSQQQQQAQQMLDAQRRNLQQRQMTPLMQFQALQPFVSMAPSGQFQTITDFTPPPSAVQAGLGAGLSAFGALGQLYGGNK